MNIDVEVLMPAMLAFINIKTEYNKQLIVDNTANHNMSHSSDKCQACNHGNGYSKSQYSQPQHEPLLWQMSSL